MTRPTEGKKKKKKASKEKKKLEIGAAFPKIMSNVYFKNNGKPQSYNQNDIKIVLPVSPFSHWIQLACQTAAEKNLWKLVWLNSLC